MIQTVHEKRTDTDVLSGPAVRAFKDIADRWKLTEADRLRLLAVPRSTYFKWLKDPRPRLPPDVLDRVSYVLGIFKALHILLPPDAADQWLHRPNRAPLFGGEPALKRLLSGHLVDLYRVRQYLDDQRGQ